MDQAFALTATAPERGQVQLQFKIAPGYYLYRHRTSVKADPAFNAGALQMPKGDKHHDDSSARSNLSRAPAGHPARHADRGRRHHQSGSALPGLRRCRCLLPAAEARGAGHPARQRCTGRGPGRARRCVGFDAIASDGNTLLLRFSPAPGYYLYRDRTSLKLEGSTGVQAGTPRWPAAQSHRDEHFGDVSVYFNQVEVPLPLRRTVADAVDGTLVVTFQGCQTDGICYPPMTRRVKLSIPAGKVSASADQAPPRNEVISPLAAAPREGANGAPLRLLPTVPNTDAAPPGRRRHRGRQ